MRCISLTIAGGAASLLLLSTVTLGQSIDQTQAPNTAKAGINKSLSDEIGAGRGNISTPNSSLYVINRDPFRAVRRGRQVFQRKFTRVQGQGAGIGDGVGDINTNIGIGAGLVDSCGGCHARPRGSAGFGGDVVTRPDSRSAPHLFGLGLKEMLADEITRDLRDILEQAIATATGNKTVTLPLVSKGINFGFITADRFGNIDTSQVQGVDPDLRVRPFFAHGATISMREFIVGALNAEMGLQACTDPDLIAAAIQKKRVVTPSGMVLDGSQDAIESPPPCDALTNANEIDPAVVDHMEFYLLNYFKPGTGQQTTSTQTGFSVFKSIGCASCHIQNLQINKDRRVADVETVYDPVNGIFNGLFATATALFHVVNDGGTDPLKLPNLQPFLVKNIFTDFKRHDLGLNFYERNYDGTLRTQFLTKPLWGIGTTAPFGHDGRSISLTDVILRHGGEAQAARDAFASLSALQQEDLINFLRSLILFPPDDTASNLDPGNRSAPNFPQFGHGSIKLTVLFNNPGDPE